MNESTPASAAATSYDDSAGIEANTTYYYIVRAIDESGGKSKWSAVAEGRTKAGQPGAPSLTLVPTGERAVRLTWVANTNTPSGVTGYELQYAEGTVTTEQFADDQRAKMSKSLSASPMYDTISGLKAGTRYTFRIQALLAEGVKSQWSILTGNEGQVVTRPARPDLTATATTFDDDDDPDTDEAPAIALTWAPVMIDGSPLGVRVGYDIQRRVSGGTWEDLPDTVTLETDPCTATVPCKVIDDNEEDGLTAKTRYFYRIRVSTETVTSLSTGSVGTSDNPLTSYWDTTDETTQ
jgi:hypothetical protein